MQPDEDQENIRMGSSRPCCPTQPSGPCFDGPNPIQRGGSPQENLAPQDAPVCSLSDIWPGQKNVRTVRVLRPDKGNVQRSGVPKPDRRQSVLKKMEKLKNDA